MIYTFQSWRNQKASDVVSNEAKTISERLKEQSEIHKVIIRNKRYDQEYKDCLDMLEREYFFLSRNLNFLENILENFYDKNNLAKFTKIKNNYLKNLISYKDLNNDIYLVKSNNSEMPEDYPKIDIDDVNEKYALSHLALNEVLIKILLHSESLET